MAFSPLDSFKRGFSFTFQKSGWKLALLFSGVQLGVMFVFGLLLVGMIGLGGLSGSGGLDSAAAIGAGLVTALVIFFVAYFVVYYGYVHTLIRHVFEEKEGVDTDLVDGWFWSSINMFAGSIIVPLVLAGLSVLVLAPLVLLAGSNVLLTVLLGLVLFMGLAFLLGYIYTGIAFFFFPIVEDGENVFDGLKTSWALSHGHRLRVLGLVLLIWLVWFCVYIPVFILDFVGMVVPLVSFLSSLLSMFISNFMWVVIIASLADAYQNLMNS